MTSQLDYYDVMRRPVTMLQLVSVFWVSWDDQRKVTHRWSKTLLAPGRSGHCGLNLELYKGIFIDCYREVSFWVKNYEDTEAPDVNCLVMETSHLCDFMLILHCLQYPIMHGTPVCRDCCVQSHRNTMKPLQQCTSTETETITAFHNNSSQL